MKKIACVLIITPLPLIAGEPSVSCPSGYAVFEENVIIATTCPAGYAGFDIESCLVANPSSGCYMFAPVGVSYTDDFGTYQFTEACPML